MDVSVDNWPPHEEEEDTSEGAVDVRGRELLSPRQDPSRGGSEEGRRPEEVVQEVDEDDTHVVEVDTSCC